MIPKIVIIAYNSADMELIKSELKNGKVDYNIKIVQTEKNYESALHNFKPDIILSNYVSESLQRLAAFKIRQKIAPQTPFILISESIGEENAIELIKNGVSDLVLKERLFHLIPKINQALEESALRAKKLTEIENDTSFDIVGVPVEEEMIKEKALEIEKKQFNDLYSQAPFCMGILKGPNHVFEMANSLYMRLIGKKNIIGKSLKEIRPEANAQGFIDILDQVYKTGVSFSATEMLVKLDKENKGEMVDLYAKFLYQARRNCEGVIDGILFFAVEVTEQVESRKKTEASEKRYRELIENLPVATYSCDAEGRITLYNKAAADIWGRKPEIGKDFWCGSSQVYNLEDIPIPLDLCPMALTLKSGKAIIGEEIIIERPDGDKRNVLSYPVPFIDAEGRVTGAVNILTDTTENKKAHWALVESEKKYRHLFENNPMPMWITELNTFTFLTVNKMAIQQYGYSREEFLCMTAVDIRPEEDKESFKQFIASCDYESTNFNKKTWNHQKKNGTIIQVEMIAHEIMYEGVPAWFILSKDITDRRKSELKLERKNKELAFQNEEKENRAAELVIANKELGFQNDEKENRAAELVIANKELAFQNDEKENRAAELAIANLELAFQFQEKENRAAELVIANKELAFQNDEKENRAAELFISNRELIKTNTELDRFVYSVSHDLRSPLTSVLGLISFIEEESQEPDTLEHAKMIRNSVNRLDDFIKNILSYSRNNRTGLEIKKILLQKTIVDIVDSLHSIKQAKGIHFEIDIKEHQPFYSDSLRVNTILENLISNAIKYHKKNQAGSYIKIKGQSDSAKLQLTITDNGIGISPKHHNKIFDMFFRISGKTAGSGIGLYIVKDTVETLQGSIEIQSEKGKGTTFIITLKNLKP